MNLYQPTKVVLSFCLTPDFLPEAESPKKPFGMFFIVSLYPPRTPIVYGRLTHAFRPQTPRVSTTSSELEVGVPENQVGPLDRDLCSDRQMRNGELLTAQTRVDPSQYSTSAGPVPAPRPHSLQRSQPGLVCLFNEHEEIRV